MKRAQPDNEEGEGGDHGEAGGEGEGEGQSLKRGAGAEGTAVAGVDAGLASSFTLTPSTAAVVFTIKNMVSNAAAGTIIGKGGETIAAIRSSTRARVAVSDSNASLPERMVTLTGTFEQVTSAFSAVFEKMLANDLPPGVTQHSSLILKLLLTNSQMGNLIGKGGAGVRTIRELTHVRVHLMSVAEMPPGSMERLATVTGEPSCVLSAFQLVCAAVANALPGPAGSGTSGGGGGAAYGAGAYAAPAPAPSRYDRYESAPTPAHGHGSYNMHASLPGAVTVVVNVSDDVVGRVIGKAGSTAAEIRALTNTEVHIARKVEGEPFRVITITGRPDNVKMAQMLVEMKQSSPQPVATLISAALATSVSSGAGGGYGALPAPHGTYSSMSTAPGYSDMYADRRR